MRLELPPPPEASDPLVTLQNWSLKHGEQAVLRDIDLIIRPRMRVAVLGPTGSGKSTLLRALAGRLPPSAGTRQSARWLQLLLWEANASREALNTEDETPLQFVERLSGGSLEDAATLLDSIGIDKWAVHRPCSCLSSGERTLVALAGLALVPKSLLLLDDPTVFLGSAAVKQVAAALAPDRWNGTLVCASQDRFFSEALHATHVAHLNADGSIELLEHAPREDDFARARGEPSHEGNSACASKLAQALQPVAEVVSESSCDNNRAERLDGDEDENCASDHMKKRQRKQI